MHPENQRIRINLSKPYFQGLFLLSPTSTVVLAVYLFHFLTEIALRPHFISYDCSVKIRLEMTDTRIMLSFCDAIYFFFSNRQIQDLTKSQKNQKKFCVRTEGINSLVLEASKLAERDEVRT